eukprot:Gregarina_sp_Poly_1__9825@NODE_62_length_16615_cov_49_436669_g53_i0_p13_GENE_NODE_62_length_16615_cov_49_436669_g53_i0NODE_62_length_16615_cov_49_436669_g53_i0_p13_ORF_typecomplete_len135_score23_34_NODE_62_length_16615_cov_49_436669_g53_i01615116555
MEMDKQPHGLADPKVEGPERMPETSQSTPSSMNTPLPTLDEVNDSAGGNSAPVSGLDSSEVQAAMDHRLREFQALLKRIEEICRMETTSRFRPPTATTTALLQGINRVAFRLRAVKESSGTSYSVALLTRLCTI